MSNIQTQEWIEWAWSEYSKEYLKHCNTNNWQADGSDFWLWLEERNLIPEGVE